MNRRFVTSEHNPDIKRVKALRDRRSVRHEQRCCIVEGPRFIGDVARVSVPTLLVIAESRADDALPDAQEQIVVPDELFTRIAATEHPQGLLAIFPFPDVDPYTGEPPLVLIADAIRDPGNLGAVIRSAAALGATSVVCARGSTDPFAPKVVRAAAASQWQVPILGALDLDQILGLSNLVIADSEAEAAIDEIDFRQATCIVIGSEGAGVSEQFRELPHVAARIPIVADVESLSAGVAASIVLYEARRQRRLSE